MPRGPFCQLCLQRGHSLIRCPLREGLMFLGHVSMMLQLPNEAERSARPSENTNNGPDWRRRRRWFNASRRMRERVTRRRGNTYNYTSRGNYATVQSMPPPPPPNTRAISMAGNASVRAVGSSSSSTLYSTYSSTSSSTTADDNLTNPSGNHSFRSERAQSSHGPSDDLPLRLSNEARLPRNSDNGGLVNENILAEIASMEHPESGYVSHWNSTAQGDTVMTGAVGAVVGDHVDGIFDLI